jgi:uncharacterized protein
MSLTRNWKASVFNNNVPDGHRVTWFNSRSSCLFALSEEASRTLESVLDGLASGVPPGDALAAQLSSLGLIVPGDVDEYEGERVAFQDRLRARETLKITIAPTMACNLRCTYCFQQHLRKSPLLDRETQCGIVDIVRHLMRGTRLLVVQWFGGEPLLAWPRICEMTEEFQRICADCGAEYYAEMLSNGTLLSADKIARLDRLAVRALQIPLDGDIATYARRKQIPLDKARAFHQFLADSLQQIVDKTGSVTIRVNVDRDNPEGGKEAVRMIRAGGCVDERIDFRLGFLNTSRGVLECIPHDCFTPNEFGDAENDFRRFLAEQGYRVYGRPARRKFPCAAPLEHSFTVDPTGRIGKCVPSIGTGESVFAQIHPGDPLRTLAEMSLSEIPYGSFDPFARGPCQGCSLLPACLGSCPKMHEERATLLCPMKTGLGERLSFYAGASGEPVNQTTEGLKQWPETQPSF